MKKTTFSLLFFLAVCLAACSAAPAVTPGQTSSGTQPSAGVTASAGESGIGAASSAPASGSPASGQPAGLSALQLAVGTLKLAGTGQPVTAAEAGQLIPLWQSLGTIETNAFPARGQQSGSATPPNFSAIQTQIQAQLELIRAAMPAGQVQAIQAMNLSAQDIQATLQQQGIRMDGFQRGGGARTPLQGTLSSAGIAGAGIPGRLVGNGTPRPGFGQGGMNFLPPGLVTALVQYLQKIAGS